MTHPYSTNSQAWCMSLRKLMGYPLYAPASNNVAWCASGSRNIFDVMQLTQLATDMSRDLVHVSFDDVNAIEPVLVSLVVRGDASVDWLPGCTLYAADETAKIELLGGGRRWLIGARQVLTSAKLPPTSRRASGEEIAMRRWRLAKDTIGPLKLTGSLWLPQGERYSNAIPQEALKVAA